MGDTELSTLPSRPGLYMLTSPSGRQYIGMSGSSMRKRWNSHCTAARQGRDTRIARAIRKYGQDRITARVLVECNDLAALKVMEEKAIEAYGTLKDYNILASWRESLDTTGYKHTAEAKSKIADAMRTRVVSDETKSRMSKANIGKKLSDAHRAKLSAAKKGKPWTEAQRESRGMNNG